MPRDILPSPTLEQAIKWLRDHGFEVTKHGDSFRVSKYGCVAGLSRGSAHEDRAVLSGPPRILLAGGPADLVDRGYQKFLKNSKLEIAATAARLKDLHEFERELAQAIGQDQIYNLALGTVSDKYLYDRVKGRPDDRLS